MPNQTLINWIKENKNKKSETEMRDELLKKGWKIEDVNQAFAPPPAQTLPQAPVYQQPYPQAAAPQQVIVQEKSSKGSWCCLGCTALVIISLLIFIVGLVGVLALVGAKGQPSTIMPPSSQIKAPTGLTSSTTENNIDLEWNKVTSKAVANYTIYRSETCGDNFTEIETVSNTTLTYADTGVEKGKTFYYVITATDALGNQSGNSNQTSAAVQSPPLVPKGIQSWADVLAKYNADPQYALVFEKVTGKTKSDIEHYVKKEKSGLNMKKTLKKGSIITNTTENYKILYHYKLPKDQVFLTDEFGNPYVMTWCGNPVKLQVPVTKTSQVIKTFQNTSIKIINIFPVYIVNIFVYAGQPVNQMIVEIMPERTRIIMGPDFAIPEELLEIEPLVSEKPAEETELLAPGEKWAIEGKLKLTAKPHDPGEYQDVTMTAELLPAKTGVKIQYQVSGTDGYTDSGTLKTDAKGKINWSIPGSYKGVKDKITVKVPSENLEGSTEYTF